MVIIIEMAMVMEEIMIIVGITICLSKPKSCPEL